jgi:hypothetical protein
MNSISLRITQYILLFSSISWAIVPTYGAAVFLAAVALMLLGAWGREKAAKKIVAQALPTLPKLSEESRLLLKRFPFFYVWSAEAKKWATTFQMSGLLCLLLAVWFFLRGIFLKEYWQLSFIVLCLAIIILVTQIAQRFDLDERVKDERYKADAEAHKQALTYLSLKQVAGHWPPVAGPEEQETPGE